MFYLNLYQYITNFIFFFIFFIFTFLSLFFFFFLVLILCQFELQQYRTLDTSNHEGKFPGNSVGMS